MVIVNIPTLQGLLVFILSKVAGIFGARTVSPTLHAYDDNPHSIRKIGNHDK